VQAFPNLGGSYWNSQSDSTRLIQTASRRWFWNSKLLERWSIETFLYVGNLLYIFVYCLLHWHKWPTLQSGGSIMYLYAFQIMKYYFWYICFILCKQHLCLSCERLRSAGLDDCSILPPGHLLKNRLGGTHDSISIQNLRFHGFACMSSQAMSRVTKEHLPWRNLRETWVSIQLRWIKIFECLVRRAQAQRRAAMTLRTDHTWKIP
jgi:hypothetical protein